MRSVGSYRRLPHLWRGPNGYLYIVYSDRGRWLRKSTKTKMVTDANWMGSTPFRCLTGHVTTAGPHDIADGAAVAQGTTTASGAGTPASFAACLPARAAVQAGS